MSTVKLSCKLLELNESLLNYIPYLLFSSLNYCEMWTQGIFKETDQKRKDQDGEW